jgi:plasmid stabilization system protein ParE
LRYVLTARAEEHLTALLYDLAEHAGWNHSMDVEETLYAAFQALAANPGIGHKRQNLTHLPVHFHYADPYLVVYQQNTTPRRVVSIFLGVRNIAKLLKQGID